MLNRKVDENIPILERNKFTRGVKIGYKIADGVMKSHPIFESKMGKELKSNIRRVSVACSIETMINNDKKLNLIYEIKPNVKKNCSHSEIYNKNFIMTINQVQYKYQVSREAEFRKELVNKTQEKLFYVYGENETGINKNYIQLTHGGDELPDFIILGIPDESFSYWIDSVSLLEEPFSLEEKPYEEKAIKLQLKKFLEENIQE